MKKYSAGDFYFKVSLWIFLCLALAGVFQEIRADFGKSTNESTPVQSIQAIRVLQHHYRSNHWGNFALTFDELVRAENLDKKFVGQNPVVRGYVFTMKVSEPTADKPAFYSISADPLEPEVTGIRHFYFDSTLGTIKTTEENRPAEATDPAF
jgi:hypothetical protein